MSSITSLPFSSRASRAATVAPTCVQSTVFSGGGACVSARWEPAKRVFVPASVHDEDGMISKTAHPPGRQFQEHGGAGATLTDAAEPARARSMEIAIQRSPRRSVPITFGLGRCVASPSSTSVAVAPLFAAATIGSARFGASTAAGIGKNGVSELFRAIASPVGPVVTITSARAPALAAFITVCPMPQSANRAAWRADGRTIHGNPIAQVSDRAVDERQRRGDAAGAGRHHRCLRHHVHRGRTHSEASRALDEERRVEGGLLNLIARGAQPVGDPRGSGRIAWASGKLVTKRCVWFKIGPVPAQSNAGFVGLGECGAGKPTCRAPAAAPNAKRCNSARLVVGMAASRTRLL